METGNQLTSSTLLATALMLMALPVVVCLVQWARRRARMVHMASKIPGPSAWPILGNIVSLLGQKREDIFAALNTITKQHLPIMCFWKGMNPEIHLSSAEDAEIILSSTVHIDKSSNYDFIKPWLGEGLLTSSGTKWHMRRKLITPTFHFKILDSFIDVFAEKSNTLVEVLEKELSNAYGFDVYPYITLCALDIICETAMGTQINAQRNKQSEYVKAIYNISEEMIQRVLRPWLYPDFIYFRSSRGKEFSRNIATVQDFTNKVIQDRKQIFRERKQQNEINEDALLGVKKRLAFLDLLLEASKDGAALSDEDIREEVDTFMFEGHDTTSAGICWTMFLLGSHPDIQEQASAEQEAIFQGSDRSPTMKDLTEMKYLERIIKETLRIYPSVPFIARHLKEDVKVGSYTLPAGVNVAVRIYQIHHNPEYFPNPDKFDPDNFLPERVQKRHPFAYVPFSAGSRNCIGQKFAMLEEKTVLSTILRRYSFTALDKPEDLKLLSELILRPNQGIRLRLKRRAQV